ncbi:recombinase family protein [Streptomyces violaceorubidus]
MTTTIAAAVATLTGRSYLRVSADKSGYDRSNEDQYDDNADVAAEHGITLLDTYETAYKDSASGSRLGTAVKDRREDFPRLMADLRGGTFGADVLVLWENSRGSRQPREWMDLIDACKPLGIRIFITNERRLYDPRNWRDDHALQDEARKAEAYSMEISERVARTLRRNGEKGKPHGLIPYGYLRTYSKVRTSKGRLVTRPEAQLPEPSEALNVIDLFVKLRAGLSFQAVSVDWSARGITSRDGVPFSPQSLSQMARKISYVGKRVRTRTVEDPETGKRRKEVLGEVDAVWPVVADFAGSPLSAEEFVTLFHEVQDMLNDPQRRTNPGGGAKHEFTMTMRCDACGGPITATRHLSADGEQAYVCRDKGCVRLSQKDDLDYVLTEAIVGALARPGTYERLSHGDDGGELTAVREQLARKRRTLAAFEAEDPESPAEARVIGRKIETLEGEIAALADKEQALTRPSPLEALFPQGPAQDVRARWDAADLSVRRAVAAVLLAPDALGQVRIKRVADAASEALPDRLRWVGPDGRDLDASKEAQA